jgi:pectinesterase
MKVFVRRRNCFLGSLLGLLLAAQMRAGTRVTVGPAGADFTTVQAAIDAAPADQTSQRVIEIQPGSYFGHTVVNRPHVTLRGSGPGTLLHYNLGQTIPGRDGQPIGWQGCAALHVTAEASDAIIEDLTLENTYGKGMQALALAVEAPRVIVRRCRVLGWQDTLRLENGPVYVTDSFISGHVDFIYGGATAFFENCELHCRDTGYIAAPSTAPGKTGFVFLTCRISFPWGHYETYLGRPWRNSPQAVFVRCELGEGIVPTGWREWNVKPPLVRFAEYGSTGKGAAGAQRVSWASCSPGDAPDEFDRTRVLGPWDPTKE